MILDHMAKRVYRTPTALVYRCFLVSERHLFFADAPIVKTKQTKKNLFLVRDATRMCFTCFASIRYALAHMLCSKCKHASLETTLAPSLCGSRWLELQHLAKGKTRSFHLCATRATDHPVEGTEVNGFRLNRHTTA